MLKYFYYIGNVILAIAMSLVTVLPYLNSHFGINNYFALYKLGAFILFILTAGLYSMSIEFFKKQTMWILGAIIFYIIFQLFVSLSSASSAFIDLPTAFSSKAFALLY